MHKRFEDRAFRNALGKFATGVTVITATTPAGEPVGVTATSFNSLSLDPPLVLWSLRKKSYSYEAFAAATHWAVHVLTANQEALSQRFAVGGPHKFEGLQFEKGPDGVPLFPDCAVRFVCRMDKTVEGGDHIILIGEVLAFDTGEDSSLVFHGGRYVHIEPTAAEN